MTRLYKNARSSTCALAIAACLAGINAAQAQDADSESQASSTVEQDDEETNDTGIVVTGSRIQSSFDRPTPVTILGAARLEDRGLTNLGDALNELPAFRASEGPATAGLTPGAGLAIGGRILDLRGLGSVRIS